MVLKERILLASVLALLMLPFQRQAQLVIQTFSVGTDQPLTYPNPTSPGNPLTGFADEHTTFFPPTAPGSPYLAFGAAATSATGTGVWGAVVLQTTDLKTFNFAATQGYNFPALAAPNPFSKCNPSDNTEFDENYAAPGSVVQDPMLPAGNLIMLYEAENHCPGGVNQQPFYATVGFARSSDNGKTWPAPQGGVSGGPSRHPVLQSPEPPPTGPHGYMGDAIPSGFVDKDASGDYYLYVAYAYFSTSGQSVRVARARLGTEPLTFLKWFNGSFSQPGIGGLDSAILPSEQCTSPEISYNDDLGLYLLIAKCYTGPAGAQLGGWYYSTATSLGLQDWTAPQLIQNSQYPLTAPCPGQTTGQDFDGFYPSTVSPGAASGHTKLTGYFFFSHVECTLASRQFLSRTFTIATQPQPAPTLTPGTVANGATYLSGGLVPGSWAQVKGTNLSNVTRGWTVAEASAASLPTRMSGTSVTVNGFPAVVYYVTPTQVNFQVPAGVSGTASVQLTNNGMTSNIVTAAAATSSPGIWPIAEKGVNYAAGVFLDGKFAGDPAIASLFRKARPNDAIQLFGTGLLPSPAGVPVNFQPVSGVTVTIGNITVPADAAGLVAVGEFQINFAVPAMFGSLPEANYPLTINVSGTSSPAIINSNPPGPLVIPIQP